MSFNCRNSKYWDISQLLSWAEENKDGTIYFHSSSTPYSSHSELLSLLDAMNTIGDKYNWIECNFERKKFLIPLNNNIQAKFLSEYFPEKYRELGSPSKVFYNIHKNKFELWKIKWNANMLLDWNDKHPEGTIYLPYCFEKDDGLYFKDKIKISTVKSYIEILDVMKENFHWFEFQFKGHLFLIPSNPTLAAMFLNKHLPEVYLRLGKPKMVFFNTKTKKFETSYPNRKWNSRRLLEWLSKNKGGIIFLPHSSKVGKQLCYKGIIKVQNLRAYLNLLDKLEEQYNWFEYKLSKKLFLIPSNPYTISKFVRVHLPDVYSKLGEPKMIFFDTKKNRFDLWKSL